MTDVRHGRRIALAVLGLLREQPMHPYEMQRQMRIRHTDDLLALKRGSLYHAINQLQRDGSIEPVETTRAGRRPERTVYRITTDGDDEFVGWLRELLSTPVPETSHFMTALAHVLEAQLVAERGLAGARAPHHQVDGAADHAAAQDGIEPGDTSGGSFD